MKKLILLVLLLGAFPIAADTYTVTVTGAKALAALERDRVTHNGAVCTLLHLATNCTKAQADAVNPVNDYTNTVEKYVNWKVKADLDRRQTDLDAQDQANFLAACVAASAGTKDTLCAAVGLPSGCLP